MASMIGASRWRQVFCAVLLSAIVLVALHSHSYIDPLDEQPMSGGHHCLLCMTAHLPSALSSATFVPLPPAATSIAMTASDNEVKRDVQITFSLYMRPPPTA